MVASAFEARSSMLRLAMLVALPVLAIGCKPDACRDEDYDGYGLRCVAGPDCDDTNQARNVDCEAVAAPDCDAVPTATGCPCFFGATTECYAGPVGTEDIGPCRTGTSACVNGHFGLCQGQIVPQADVCNDVDDDCDARTDERVRSPCGGCNAACTGDTWGIGEFPFVPNAELVLTSVPALELARAPLVTPNALWLANSAEDTVSRLDTTSATEVARHVSGGDDPSRIAVDFRGDVLVTNRAFEGQSTVTKIASDLSRCVDADLSMTIRTSTSPTDVPTLAEDECVTWSVDVGEPLSIARAIAIDGSMDVMGDDGGDVWVGLFRSKELLHLDGRDGHEIERISLPISPFFAAFDPRGVLWVLSLDGYLASVDRRTSPPSFSVHTVPYDCYETYGLAIDARGEILITGFACNQVIHYVPTTRMFRVEPTLPNPRSAIFLGDEAWVSHTDGRLSEMATSPLETLRTVDLHALGFAPLDSIGIAIDGTQHVWTVSAIGGGAGRGLATRVDPVSGEVTAQVPVGLAPHVQGDLTGHTRRAYVPEGQTTQIFTGCVDTGTNWRAVHVDADVGAVGTVTIEARSGATQALLEAATFVPLGTLPANTSPFPISVEANARIELRMTLATDARDGTPSVRSVGVEYTCVVVGPE